MLSSQIGKKALKHHYCSAIIHVSLPCVFILCTVRLNECIVSLTGWWREVRSNREEHVYIGLVLDLEQCLDRTGHLMSIDCPS